MHHQVCKYALYMKTTKYFLILAIYYKNTTTIKIVIDTYYFTNKYLGDWKKG